MPVRHALTSWMSARTRNSRSLPKPMFFLRVGLLFTDQPQAHEESEDFREPSISANTIDFPSRSRTVTCRLVQDECREQMRSVRKIGVSDRRVEMSGQSLAQDLLQMSGVWHDAQHENLQRVRSSTGILQARCGGIGGGCSQEALAVSNRSIYFRFNKRPYCNAHTPVAKHTTVADTPEARRLAENTKIQSQVKYHEEFERNMKGKATQVRPVRERRPGTLFCTRVISGSLLFRVVVSLWTLNVANLFRRWLMIRNFSD